MKGITFFRCRHLVSRAVVASFKEVRLMREGKKEKTSLDTLFSDIDKWTAKSK